VRIQKRVDFRLGTRLRKIARFLAWHLNKPPYDKYMACMVAAAPVRFTPTISSSSRTPGNADRKCNRFRGRYGPLFFNFNLAELLLQP
jgi:hypothetical protein